MSRNTPSASRRRTQHTVLWLIHRLFWASMLVIHFGALHAVDVILSGGGASAGGKEHSALQTIALVTAAWFCMLKLFDVPWLRGNPGWRPKVAGAVIVALLHVAVVERATGQDSAFTPAHLGVFLIAATVAKRRTVASWLSRIRRRVESIARAPSVGTTRPGPFSLAWTLSFLPLLLYLRAGPLGLRAPPVR